MISQPNLNQLQARAQAGSRYRVRGVPGPAAAGAARTENQSARGSCTPGGRMQHREL